MQGCDGHEGNYSSAGIKELSAASPGVKGEREKAVKVVRCHMVFWGKYLAEMAAAVSGKLLCSGTLLRTPALIA